MDFSVDAFQAKVQDLAGQYFPTSKPELQEANPLRLEMRIVLSSDLFIDIFYGVSKKRIDFAVIKATERIFGIDNLNGWHRHPFGGVTNRCKIVLTSAGILSCRQEEEGAYQSGLSLHRSQVGVNRFGHLFQ